MNSNLPTISGTTSFEDVRSNGYVYVDKTKYLYQLITRDRENLCYRPRGFGKSLVVSTLEAICKGKRELFKGLYIDSTDYDWKTYPVIQVDFSTCRATSGEETDAWIQRQLLDIAKEYQIPLEHARSSNDLFDDLLQAFYNRGEQVVVLIDEYDKVVIDNLQNPELPEIMHALDSFYILLKAMGKCIKFALLTGITRYSNATVFGGLNNLKDISNTSRYATMYGYTQEELEQYFAPYIEAGCKKTGLDREIYLAKIKRIYSGYRFADDAESVYNPVDINSFFADGGSVFRPYWVETGNTRYVVELAKKAGFDPAVHLSSEHPVSRDGWFSISDFGEESNRLGYCMRLLYQTGYLTIDGADPYLDSFVVLKFPNKAVAHAFGASARQLGMYTGNQIKSSFLMAEMMDCLELHDLALFMDYLKDAYTDTSRSWPKEAPGVVFSITLSTFFYSCKPLKGMSCEGSKYNVEMVLPFPDQIYLFTFRINQNPNAALQQIKDKHSVDRFKTEGKPIHLVGVSFYPEDRNFSDWKEETICNDLGGK